MIFQKNYISPTFSPWVGIGSKTKTNLENFFLNIWRLPFIGHSEKILPTNVSVPRE